MRSGWIVLAVAVLTAAVGCGRGSSEAPVLSSAELQGRWWSWVSAGPDESDPDADQDGSSCARYQPDDVWCVPAILCVIDPAAPASRVDEVQHALRGSAQEFWRVVRKRQDVTLSWAPGALQHPVKVATAAITAELVPAPVLRESLPGGQQGP